MPISKLDPEDEELRSHGTYLIIAKNNSKAYVGSTNNLFKRRNDHASYLRNNKHHNPKLQREYNKGTEFDFIPVTTETRADAYDLEQIIIDELKGNKNFLNVAIDARSGSKGMPVSEETLQKLKASHLGHKVSEETKRKISEGLKERPVIEKTRQLIGHAHKNKIVSQETREKLSKVNSEIMRNKQLSLNLPPKEFAYSEERRNKIGLHALGNLYRLNKTHTKESIQKNIQNQPHRIPVVVNGVEYSGIRAACKELKITAKTLTKRLNDNEYKNWIKK